VRLLLDTHVLFWALISPGLLSVDARNALERDDADVYVSVASAWEISIKVGLGKWPEAGGLAQEFAEQAAAADFGILPITLSHVRTAGLMNSPHRDPFDRHKPRSRA
jgi:PIN domain nuclease of toxin-antitoxin system